MITKGCMTLLCATLLLARTTLATEMPKDSKAAKGLRIKEILAKYPLKLQRGSGFGNHSKAFCDGIFAAMKRADKVIEYIEPVVKTDDPKHPLLARYNEGNLCSIGHKAENNTPYEGDIRFIGDRDYRLYRIDAAKKFKNGLEEFIYVEQILPKPETSNSFAKFTGYYQVDFERCEYYPLVAVTSPTFRVHGVKETLNAMLNYQRRNYVVDFLRGADSSGTGITAWLYVYKPSKYGHAHFPLSCKWEYLTTEPSGE